MPELDYCKGLRVYGVYRFDEYPDVNILVTDIVEGDTNNIVKGLAFDKTGALDCMYVLNLPLLGEEVGYVYDKENKFSVRLVESE